jgi:hypothetical protein
MFSYRNFNIQRSKFILYRKINRMNLSWIWSGLYFKVWQIIWHKMLANIKLSPPICFDWLKSIIYLWLEESVMPTDMVTFIFIVLWFSLSKLWKSLPTELYLRMIWNLVQMMFFVSSTEIPHIILIWQFLFLNGWSLNIICLLYYKFKLFVTCNLRNDRSKWVVA